MIKINTLGIGQFLYIATPSGYFAPYIIYNISITNLITDHFDIFKNSLARPTFNPQGAEEEQM